MNRDKKNQFRILYHIAASGIGGSTYSFFEILKNLEDEQFQLVVLVTKNECQEFIDLLKEFNVEIVYEKIRINAWLSFNFTEIEKECKIRRFIKNIKSIGIPFRHVYNAIRVYTVIKKHHIDLVHTNDENIIDASLGCFMANSKHVWHIRSRIGKDGLVTHPFGDKFVMRVINSLSDKIIVNSEFTRGPWQKSKFVDKVTLIYNGINVERFSNGRGCLKKEYGLAHGSHIVTMVTTAPEIDGLNYFIDAAAFTSEILANVFFFVVGKTNSEDSGFVKQQEKRIAGLNLQSRLFFIGYRTDIPDILADTSVVVEPMQNGSWSRVVLESMAAGVPVIAVEANKKSDFIEDGITGILVNEPSKIGDALIAILKNDFLRKCISTNAIKHVGDHYGGKKYAENIAKIYDGILKN